MALITAPTADDVYSKAGHNGTAGLNFETFGVADDATVIELINDEILPLVVRRVNAAADEAAFPNDFPLSSDIWQSARPTFDGGQIAEEVANQEALFVDVMRLMAASQLLERVATTNEFWINRAALLEARAETLLAQAQTAVINTVKRTTLGQEEGRAGFGMLTINTTPRPAFDEFGYPEVVL